MNTKKRKNLLAYTMAFAMIILMAAASELRHNHEFILPEIAAMVIAMWVYRDPNWLRHPLQICLAPTLTSVIGFTVNHLPAAYLCKVGIDFILIMACLRLIQSNFAPSLATGLLPLITDGHDWKLVLIIFLATLILMLVVIFFRMNASLEKKAQIHYKYTYFFLCLIFVWIGICWITGFGKLAVIPPIIVVVYESIQKSEYSATLALKQVAALTVSATIGTLLFLALDCLVIITVLDMMLMLLLQWLVKIRMPAIYAFPLLPFIFTHDVVLLLPLTTVFTCLFMFTAAVAYKKIESAIRPERVDVDISI